MRQCRLILIIVGWASAGLAEPLPVHIATAALSADMGESVVTGTLQAIEEFPVSFPQGGRVISVAVREGDSVVQGQELARVDPTQADAGLRAAQASLGGAEAALREAQQASDRAAELLTRGAGTRAEVDTATRSLLAAQATRDQAEAQLSKARTAQGNTVLRAARAGIVTARSVEPGQVVNPGQKVVSMAADGGLEGVFNAPDGVDLEAFLGARVRLTLVDQPDSSLNATISEVSPLVEPSTGAVIVRAQLDGKVPAGVVFGSPVVGHLDLPQLPAITVPWTALTALAGAPAVWVVDPATMQVAQKPVSVVAYGADTVRLSDGIVAGQMVVTDGAQLLYPGRTVVQIAGGN